MAPKDEVVLRTSASMMLVVLVGSAAFVVFGIGMLRERPFVAWPTIGFGALGVVVGFLGLVPGSSSLRLCQSGFTIKKCFIPWHYHWKDVTGFDVMHYSGFKYVGFDFTGVYRVGLWGRLTRTLSGCAGYLVCYYGDLSAEELAALMNEWKYWCGNNGGESVNPGRPAAVFRFEAHLKGGPRRPHPRRSG
jgi:hypothetical protein